MKTKVLILIMVVFTCGVYLNAANKKKIKSGNSPSYTQIEIPNVPDSLKNVSVYQTVKVNLSDIPVNMKGPDVDFVKQYNVPTNCQNITALFQKAIDDLAAKGGGKIHISKGDYQIGRVALKSNIHLLFDKEVIIRPYSDSPATVVVFSVGSEKENNEILHNVSIQGVNGRAKILLPKEMNGFDTKFTFINSRYVKDFYYANFDIYDHKTVISSLSFAAADRNDENFIGPTHGLVMNITVVDAHYGYGLVQAQAARDIRFYNLHGIGGVTLRLETGAKKMNETQFGGVFDIVGQNISVANGHAGVMCGPHGMTNGIAVIQDVTALSSGTGFSIGESKFETKDTTYYGTFAKGTSIKNVTAIFGFNAQIKTKELWRIPEEYLPLIGKPEERAIIEPAPAHTCVSISTITPVIYDRSTFVAKGYKYGDPIRISNGKDTDEEKQKRFSDYIKKKYNLKTVDSKKM